jgi:hypothetical protein
MEVQFCDVYRRENGKIIRADVGHTLANMRSHRHHRPLEDDQVRAPGVPWRLYW